MSASSMKTKMSIAVSLLLTVVLSVLALAAFRYFEQQLKGTISRDQFTLVSAMADEIDSKILNAQKELVAVAATLKPELADNPGQAQTFLDSRAGMRTVFDGCLAIFSRDGRLMAVSPAEPQIQGRNYSYRDYIRDTVATGRPQISSPFFSTQHHRHPLIMFTAPILNDKGELAGILAGAVDLLRNNLLGKLADIKIGEKGYLYLYSTDRTMIVHPDRTRILRRDVPPGVNRLYDLAIGGFEGTGETVNSRGLHAVSSFKHLRSTNWILAANFPQAEVYAPIKRAQRYMLAAFFVALLLSIAAVRWFMHLLTAPLLQFTRHVKGIADKIDAPTPIRIAARDEIGTLAQAFNEMIAAMDEQKRTIREQKDFLENLLLNSAIPTFALDSSHRVIIWNKACEELTGVKAEELAGTADTWKAFYRSARPVLADLVMDDNDDGLPDCYGYCGTSPFAPDGLQAEGWCLTHKGEERYVFFHAAPVRNDAGEIVAVIQTAQDITERRRVEEELECKNVILSTQQENSIDGILVVSENGTIISYNRRFVDLWNIPPELVAAKDDGPVLQLLATRVADPDSFVARVKYLYKHRDEKSREEIFLRDGRVFDRYSAPMQGNEGKFFGRVWYFRDVTESKRMQEELVKAQKLESLGVLAGGIAHDFNNILTGILGNLSLANALLDPSHKIARYLGDCEKAAVQASRLTRQLLTFARGGEPVKKLLEPAALIRETATFVLRGSNVRSIIETADDLWNIEADSGQLNQALHNILINAVQAMPDGGEVTVRVMNEALEPDNIHQLRPGHYLRIVVTDRGCGIPSENLARIFDPYFTTKPEGNGLGLASVYSIVKRHGGAVEVASTVGAGSSVIIHLPAAPEEQPEVEAAERPTRPVGNGRILIMDDEDFIRDIASEILQFIGYDVVSCGDGGEAVKLFRAALLDNAPFDAVILDLTIPGGMGGKEAAALMLEIDPAAVLIVSSGYSNDPVIADYRRFGFSGVVSKPFDTGGLARELESLVRKNAGHRSAL